jgi:hypothetical protein
LVTPVGTHREAMLFPMMLLKFFKLGLNLMLIL